jgi:SAM-dependent methyltransferase
MSELKLETRYCTLCGQEGEKSVKYPPNFSEDDLNAAVFSARRMPDRRHFRLIECKKCGIIYSDPACDPSLLAKLYLQGLVNYSGQEEQIYSSYAAILDRALPSVKTKGTFLEIGGGRGFMLRYGVEHGFSAQIEIEPSADAEKKFEPASANARFIRRIFAKDTLPANSVSLACFFQMLDHVPNPAGFLKDVLDTLEPEGIAISVTHNTRALSAKLLGERSPIYDIEHTYLYNPENMAKLFAHVGFEVIETFPVSNRYALRHWLNLAPIGKGIKKIILSVLEKTGLADMKINLRAGNFGIVARKPAGKAQ